MNNPCAEIAEELLTEHIQPSMAEILISMAHGFNEYPRDHIIQAVGPEPIRGMELTISALKFVKLSPAVQLRAMIEDWSLDRIIRELHN